MVGVCLVVSLLAGLSSLVELVEVDVGESCGVVEDFDGDVGVNLELVFPCGSAD